MAMAASYRSFGETAPHMVHGAPQIHTPQIYTVSPILPWFAAAQSH